MNNGLIPHLLRLASPVEEENRSALLLSLTVTTVSKPGRLLLLLPRWKDSCAWH